LRISRLAFERFADCELVAEVFSFLFAIVESTCLLFEQSRGLCVKLSSVQWIIWMMKYLGEVTCEGVREDRKWEKRRITRQSGS